MPLKTFLDFPAAQPKSTRFLGVMITGATVFNNTYQQTLMENASLVFVAGERDLERVYVDGQLLVQNGVPLGQDTAGIRIEVNQRVAAMR